MKYSIVHTHEYLPAEVIFLVLEEVLQHGDSSTLKAMSLASKAFLPLCRSKLFRDVSIKFASDRHYSQRQVDLATASENFIQFTTFLTSNTHIIKSIRRLSLHNVSTMSKWSLKPGAPLPPVDQYGWSTTSGPLVRLLGQAEYLQALEIRSEIELDWTTFDVQIKRSIYDLLQRPSCAFASLGMSSIVNIRDTDLCMLLSTSADISFSRVWFTLEGPKSLPEPPGCLIHKKLETLQLDRSMVNDALDMVRYYPESFSGVRRLIMESLSSAAPVSQFWTFARAIRETLNHLEWWFEVPASRTHQDAVELQQLDLSIFPELRSVAMFSSQSGELINLMAILEATGADNHIESISIIMPSSLDKFVAFRPSVVWRRLDIALGSNKFRRHLREVILCFAWTNQPIPSKSVTAIFASFKKNLPSLRGKDIRVMQQKARAF